MSQPSPDPPPPASPLRPESPPPETIFDTPRPRGSDAVPITRTHAAASPETVFSHAPVQVPPDATGDASHFGRYRLLAQLGQGGMGVVWRAWDPLLCREVALKQIHPNRAGGDDAVHRFLREARVAARLRHPGIVGVFDIGVAEGQPFVTMEFIEGDSLADGPPDRSLADQVRILADVADAVGHAHTQGVIHRDLKPSNVLIDRAGRAFVADFGLAKEVAPEPGSDSGGPPLTLSGQVLGTPAYMSPEQVEGDAEAIGPRSDIWSLGVMLFEILTDRLPFGVDGTFKTLYAVLHDDPEPPRSLRPGVPAELEAVCLKALEKDPTGRYAGAGEFAAELRRWLGGEPVLARKHTGAFRVWRAMARRKALVLGALAVLCGFLLVLGWVGHERTRARERATAMLARIAPLVQRFEDSVYTRPTDMETRKLIAEQPLGMLDQLISDHPGLGAAYAWRGMVRRLLHQDDSAVADFDRACTLEPGSPLCRILRGMDRVERYVRLRGLPIAMVGPTGIVFAEPNPDTPETSALRQGGLRDLQVLATEKDGTSGDLAPADLRIVRALAILAAGVEDSRLDAFRELEGLDHPKAWKLRGDLLYRRHRFEEAIESLQRAVERWPQDDAGWVALGDARVAAAMELRQRGRDSRAAFGRAIEAFEEALRINSDEHRARFSRASALQWLGSVEFERGGDALSTLEKARAEFDALSRRTAIQEYLLNNRGNVFQSMGEVKMRRGHDPMPDYRAAIADFESALALDPSMVSPRHNLATIPALIGDYDASRGVDPRPLYRESISALRALLAIHPRYSLAWSNLGRSLLSLAEAEIQAGADPVPGLEEATAALSAALAEVPDMILTWNHRGNVHVYRAMAAQARGEDPLPWYAKAQADIDRALELAPGEPDSLLNRGQVRHRLGEWLLARGRDAEEELQRALEDYGGSLRTNPAQPATWANRAGVLMLLGDAAHARGENPEPLYLRSVQDATQSLELNPRHAPGWNNRGLAHHNLGEVAERRGEDPTPHYRRAIAQFDEALALSPGLPSAHNNRGIAWWSLGLVEEAGGRPAADCYARAEADYLAVIARTPQTARMNLGLLYRSMGRYAESIASLEQAAIESPADADWCRQEIARTKMAEDGRASWRWWIGQGLHQFEQGAFREARIELERGLARASADGADLPARGAGAPGSDPKTLSFLAQARFAMAAIEAQAAVGCERAGEPSAEVPPREREQRIARALEHLEHALRLGFDETLEPLDEMDILAPLRGNPGFADLLERSR